MIRVGCSRSTVRYTLGPVGSTLTNGFGTRKRRTPRRVLLPEFGFDRNCGQNRGVRRALVCPCRHRPQCGRGHRFRAQHDVPANFGNDLLKKQASSTGSGQGSTFQECVEAASLAMPTNAEKSLRTAARFLSSRFASSASLASCCSLGKLIKRSNAFSFSLRLRSAFLSILSCSRFRSRCSRSCPRRTRSSWRRASALSSRAFLAVLDDRGD